MDIVDKPKDEVGDKVFKQCKKMGKPSDEAEFQPLCARSNE